MNHSSPAKPDNLKEYINQVGQILIKEYSKQRFYKPDVVSIAANKYNTNISQDDISWAMCIYCSHHDFDTYHIDIEKNYSYPKMRAEILGKIKGRNPEEYFNNKEDIEISWLDLGEEFIDIVDIGGGIGDLFDLF